MAKANTTKATTDNKRCVLYARVSTVGQAEDGLSLGIQVERLQAYATLRGLEIVACIVEPGVSGSVPIAERPEGARVAELVEAGEVAHVVAIKLDRLFRDAADALVTTREWDSRGTALHLADMGGMAVDTSSAMGRYFLTMLAGMAEMERALITERTTAGRRRKAELGGYTGGKVPFGWELVESGELEPNPREQAVIEACRELSAAGLSLRAIGRELDKRGLEARSGKPWHPQAVKMALAARAAE